MKTNLIYLIVLISLALYVRCEINKTIGLSLFKGENNLLYTYVEVGQPAQKVKLLVDILSVSSWIAGAKCTWFYNYVAGNVTTFFEDKSNTIVMTGIKENSKKELSRYIAEGNVSYDFLSLDSGLNVKNNDSQNITLSFVLASYFISDLPINGILAFDKVNENFIKKNTSKTLLDELFIKGHISKRIFYINGTNNSLILGDYPSYFYNSHSSGYNYSSCSTVKTAPANIK